MNDLTVKPMTLLEMQDAIAKTIADVIGHGMREKCVPHAQAVMTKVVGPQLLLQVKDAVEVTDEMVERACIADEPMYAHCTDDTRAYIRMHMREVIEAALSEKGHELP
jgi:hypothetical protein